MKKNIYTTQNKKDQRRKPLVYSCVAVRTALVDSFTSKTLLLKTHKNEIVTC